MATEHLVFLINLDGVRAKTAYIRRTVSGNPKAELGRTVAIARGRMCTSFDVIEQCDAPEGVSEQRLYRQIMGVPQ